MADTHPEIEEALVDIPSTSDVVAELCEVLKGREQEILKLLRYQEYMGIITPLQEELVKLQEWVRENGLKLLVLFEGRDAAGKGGTIKRFMEFLNPRICRVVALDKPTEKESGQWYFQRYVSHLPGRGEIALFDRSWYNRAVVERVMGFCTEPQVEEFYRSVPEFERMLVRSGIRINKFWFSVSRDAQEKRFYSRESDLRKTWKLSPVDQESRERWEQFTFAKEEMFRLTSISEAPWIIFKSDNKKQARINSIRYFLSQFDYSGKNRELLAYDRAIVRTVDEEMGID
ncbi:MAG: polyphosphate kinase 2 [Gammaproteobacteria bacterium]|nr:polyphosphate kinase 2 [Gammaproteobacteria bacterium]